MEILLVFCLVLLLMFLFICLVALLAPDTSTTSRESFFDGSVLVKGTWWTGESKSDELLFEICMPGTYEIKFKDLKNPNTSIPNLKDFTLTTGLGSIASRTIVHKKMPKNIEITISQGGRTETQKL